MRLDVERTGDIARSMMVLHYQHHLALDALGSAVKLMFVGLIDARWHWNHEIEEILEDIYLILLILRAAAKTLIPRENAGLPGQSLVWALN